MATYDLLEEALEARPSLEGVTPADIAELPEPLRETLRTTLRAGTISSGGLASALGLNQKQAGRVVDLLVEKGFLAAAEGAEGEAVFRINLARRKGRAVPGDIWELHYWAIGR